MTDYKKMENRSLYLVRHGERLDAVDKNWYRNGANKFDPPLSEQGEWQAQRLGDRLAQEPIDFMFASPYLRALQTAQPIAEKLDMPFYVDSGIGEWLGRSMMPEKPNIIAPIKRAVDFSYMGLSHPIKIEPEYPENLQQIFDRLQNAVDYLLESYDGNLLLVGHGRTVTGIAHRLIGKPESHFKYDLACITKLDLVDGTWHLRLNADTSHLTETTIPHFV